MEQFLFDNWNGPIYQEIRSALAAGELHSICRQPNNCPIAARLRRARGRVSEGEQRHHENGKNAYRLAHHGRCQSSCRPMYWGAHPEQMDAKLHPLVHVVRVKAGNRAPAWSLKTERRSSEA